ncbi:hypothetical protein ABIB30_005436 [Pedobacter sp. UYP1]
MAGWKNKLDSLSGLLVGRISWIAYQDCWLEE